MNRRQRKTIAWMLLVVMTFSPAMVYSQPPPATDAAPAVEKAKIDLGYVPPDAAAALVAFPRRVLTAPEMDMLPIEVLTALGKKELGIDPLQIKQLLILLEPPAAEAKPPVPRIAVVLHMAAPLGEGKVLMPMWERTEEGQLDGKTYRKATEPDAASIFRADDRTLLFGHDDLLRKLVRNHANPQEGKLGRLLAGVAEPPDAMAAWLLEPFRPLITAELAHAPLPPPLADLKQVPELVSSIAVKVHLLGGFSGSLTVRGNSPEAAEQLEKIVEKLIETARQGMAAEAAKLSQSEDPVQQATGKYMTRMSKQAMAWAKPVRKGESLTLSTAGLKNSQMIPVTVIGALVAMLLPALAAANEADRRARSVSNLKQIGLTMQVSNTDHGRFPARASFDKQGKPLLSWRVHMLPQLDQLALYQQFHLDEPWDSEHNKKLIPLMPTVFQNPSGKGRQGMAHYLAVCGKGLAFDGTQGRTTADFKGGLSNTIMVVEADDDRAVIWTKPADWEYDAQRPMAGLGHAHPTGFCALFGDGAVSFLHRSLDLRVFRSLLQIGEKDPPVNLGN